MFTQRRREKGSQAKRRHVTQQQKKRRRQMFTAGVDLTITLQTVLVPFRHSPTKREELRERLSYQGGNEGYFICHSNIHCPKYHNKKFEKLSRNNKRSNTK